jgi:hypothetical protein
MDTDFHKIGDPIPDPPPAVFELVIYDHVPFIDPRDYKITDLEGIDPRDYFITSGDAVEKARVLDKDLWKYVGGLNKQLYQAIAAHEKCSNAEAQALVNAGKIPNKFKLFKQYNSLMWKVAGQSRSMIKALLAAKGANIFLETEWNNHKLLCIPKNPRR